MAAVVASRRARSRLDAVSSRRTGAVAPIRRRRRSGWRSASTTSSPTSTGFAPWSTTAAAPRRDAHAATTLLYPLLDLVTTLDPHFKVAVSVRRDVPVGALPGGPGRPDQAIAAAASAASSAIRAAGSTSTTSASSITGGCTTTARPPTGSCAAPSSPARRSGCKPLAATTLADGRQPRLVAAVVDAAGEVRHGLHPESGRAPPAAARCHGHDRRADTGRCSGSSSARAARRDRGRSWPAAERLRGRARRSDRHAVSFSIRKLGYIDVSRKSALWPLPRDTERQEPPRP